MHERRSASGSARHDLLRWLFTTKAARRSDGLTRVRSNKPRLLLDGKRVRISKSCSHGGGATFLAGAGGLARLPHCTARAALARPEPIAFTKAVGGLAGVGDFQSCADECAYSVARARGGDPFACLGLEHWMDAFYGEALNIESRTDEWSEKLYLSASRPKRRRLSASTSTRSSLLDRAWLRDLGVHATSFMAAVRELPYFKKD